MNRRSVGLVWFIMKLKNIVLVTLMTGLAFIDFCLAENRLEVVTEEWPPYNYTVDGKLTGFSTEVVEATLKRAGLSYLLRLGVWEGAYQRALTQKNVLIYTLARTPERESLFYWIGPLAPRQVNLYKLKSRTNININQLSDAKNYVTGLVKNDALHVFFKSKGFVDGQNLQAVDDQALNIKMLFAGRIDFISDSALSLSWMLSNEGLSFDKLEKVLVLIDGGGYYLALNRSSDKALVEKIQKAFENVVDDGSLAKISTRYLNP